MYLDVWVETRESELDTFSRDSHIYKREIVARNYDRSFIRAFRQIEFDKLIPQMLTAHCDDGWKQLKVFEGGVGTGLFTIPIIKHILQRDGESFLVGNDNSKAMLEVLFDKPEFQALQNRGGGRVKIDYGDLEVIEDYPEVDFNVLVFAGVFHCLTRGHAFLKQIDRILERNGILIMVFKTDAFTRLQCGESFSYSSLDSYYGNFWRYYHYLRSFYHTPIDRRCRFIYDVPLVNKLIQLQFNNRYLLQKIHEFTWSSTTPMEKMICAIEHGLTFATGQGVSPAMLEKLGQEMKEWLSSNHLEEKEVEIDHKMELVVWKKTV